VIKDLKCWSSTNTGVQLVNKATNFIPKEYKKEVYKACPIGLFTHFFFRVLY